MTQDVQLLLHLVSLGHLYTPVFQFLRACLAQQQSHTLRFPPQIFQVSKRVLGPALFSRLFRPLVYDLFIAGEEEDEVAASMGDMGKRGLVPLLSPMLEEEEPNAGASMDR